MFYLSWILLTGTGILASIAVFLWALRSGQFADQGRARYLPLCEPDSPSPASKSPKLSGAAYVFLLILGVGVIAMLSPVILILLRIKG
jgi:cbb3-type cytochrome oxidase maturation protein